MNIAVFLSDQQHLAYARDPRVCPRIAEFLQTSTDFQNAFTPTPICSPARASIQTGLLPHQHRLIHNTHQMILGHENLPEGTVTIADRLGERNYQCGYSGKWHVGKTKKPTDHGYHDCPPTVPLRLAGRLDEVRDAVLLPGIEGIRGILSGVWDVDANKLEPMLAVTEAVGLMKKYSQDSSRPFFVFASCTPPHVPCICPPSVTSLFSEEDVILPESWQDQRPDQPYSWKHHFNAQNLCEAPRDERELRRFLAHYQASNRLVDDAFGKMLDSIAELGLADDTVVIYATDHGEFAGEHGMIGKGEYLSECLLRVPLGIRVPGTSPRVVSDYVSLCDLFSTFLDVAGISEDHPSTSRSLLPGIRGQDLQFPEVAFSEHHGSLSLTTVRGVKTPKFSYVYRGNETDEFYCLEEDPWERNNRIDDPEIAKVVKQLQSMLLARAQETGDPAQRLMEYSFTSA